MAPPNMKAPAIPINSDSPPAPDISPQLVLAPEQKSKKSGFMNSGDISSDPCCMCMLCVFGTGYCVGSIILSPFIIIYALGAKCSELQNRTLFDNVLADTENAFQTLAKALVFVQDITMREWSLICYCLCGYWLEILGDVLSFCFVAVWTVVLILPSFFTLLIVRTTKIEKESKAFGGKVASHE
jgi:hypothetical protein